MKTYFRQQSALHCIGFGQSMIRPKNFTSITTEYFFRITPGKTGMFNADLTFYQCSILSTPGLNAF